METIVLGNGRTAEVLAYDDTSVIKLFRPFMDDAYVKQEYAVAMYAFQNNVPTPEPISVVRQQDRTGIVYRKINGKSLLKILSDEPMHMKSIACRMAALHHRIHTVSFDNTTISQKKNIEHAIRCATGIGDSEKEKIIGYLHSLPEGNSLCHGDFHPDNIMEGESTWIIDWMTGSSGNPLCDVARTKMVLETSEIPDTVSPGMKLLLKFGQRKLAQTYVKEYCKIGNVKQKDIDKWLLPLYAARLVENLSDAEKSVILKKIRKEKV
jgi:uncharacterized protein (TIGR02172 family)